MLDLDHAADIAGDDDIRRDALDRLRLACAQLPREVGLEDIVGPRRATAEMSLRDIADRESRAVKQRPRLARDLLNVPHRAWVVIGEPVFRHLDRFQEPDLDDPLGHVAGDSGDPSGNVAVVRVVGEQMSIIFHSRPAAGRIHDHGVQSGRQLLFPGRQVGQCQRPRLIHPAHMERQRTAAARARRDDHGTPMALKQPDRGRIDVAVERLLGAAREQRDAVAFLALRRVDPWHQHAAANHTRLEIYHRAEGGRQDRAQGAADGAEPQRCPQTARIGEHMGQGGAKQALAPRPAEVVLDIGAADVAEMHIVDIDRAGGHAGLARQAAVEVVDRLGVRRPTLLQHRLDQVDTAARAVVLVPGQHIGRTARGAEPVMDAIGQDLRRLGIAGHGKLPLAE
jgi:hypothetical protein